jgi:hypothetical protein
MKFRENPSSGSRVFPCERTDMNIIVAFRKFANASYNMKTSVMKFQFSYWQSEAEINKETQ